MLQEDGDEDNDKEITHTVSHAQAIINSSCHPDTPMSTTVLVNSLLTFTAKKRFQALELVIILKKQYRLTFHSEIAFGV